MPPARHILKAPVFHLGGIVGMSRPGNVPEISIVPRAGIGIANDRRQRGTAGSPLAEPRQKLRLVPLLPRGGPVPRPRGPAVQKDLELLQVHRLTRRQAVHRHPDGRGVGLTKDGNGQLTVINTAHRAILIMKYPRRSVKAQRAFPPPAFPGTELRPKRRVGFLHRLGTGDGDRTGTGP